MSSLAVVSRGTLRGHFGDAKADVLMANIVRVTQKAHVPLVLVEKLIAQRVLAGESTHQEEEKLFVERAVTSLGEIHDAIVYLGKRHLLSADNVSEVFSLGPQATHYAGILSKLKEWDSSPEVISQMKELLRDFPHLCGAVYGNMLSLGRLDNVLGYMPDLGSSLVQLSKAEIRGFEEPLYRAWRILQTNKRNALWRGDRWPSISFAFAEMVTRGYFNQEAVKSLLNPVAVHFLVQLFWFSEAVSFENFELAARHPDLRSVVREVLCRKRVVQACAGPGELIPCSEAELTQILRNRI